jgi:hypothetical protein
MRRRCDGADPNLTRDVRFWERPAGPWPDAVPCDCGLVFDDVQRSTVWPHRWLAFTMTAVGTGEAWH